MGTLMVLEWSNLAHGLESARTEIWPRRVGKLDPFEASGTRALFLSARRKGR